MRRFISCLIILVLSYECATAQTEKRWLKHQVNQLAGNNMYGRGYVNMGRDKAAKYIIKEFRQFGLKPVDPDSSFVQEYHFAVNTFPDEVSVSINKQELIPGEDFLVDAASHSFDASHMKIRAIDFDKIPDSAAWEAAKRKLNTEKYAYYFLHVDSFFKRTKDHEWNFSRSLDAGCYIIPKHGKMFWTVATQQMPATMLYIEDSVLPDKLKKIDAHVHAEFLLSYKNLNKNIVGCVPGEVKDSFIVFTAHYDHLGMMGSEATFNGASDNASGTAMMLYLADYFAQHPQHYTMVFMAFSGEEAGILGSEYFVEHPLIPLSNIKFLTNIDIMGDATDGITVVNATEYPKQFEILQTLNKQHFYLPQVKSRGKTHNSDHYHFTEKGVPAFFIYSNGGPGYYHDVFDTPSSLPFTNIDKAAKLFVEFGEKLNTPK